MNFLTDDASLKNKLRYKAHYRGCKEIELIFRAFCAEHLNEMNESDMEKFEKILDLEDSIFLDLIHKKIEINSVNSVDKDFLKKIFKQIFY
jgi:succinate dehydrogenase flavin-adding protein (antitoxin of CptAB toxin-antitoxin module)